MPAPIPLKPPRGLAILLAALAALGPFSIDTYLPSFHDIGHKLNATSFEVQQTLTAFLVPFAFMTLWYGAISDAFGRRRLVLITLALFGLASTGCIFATNIEHLLVFRALQGMTAGAGIVISRAIVRDLFDGASAQRMISHISMMFAIAPAVAPLLGGWLQAWFDWRAVFAFLAFITTLLWLACWRWLPETLSQDRRQPLNPKYLARTYFTVAKSRIFFLASLALTFNFLGYFIYILSAPAFLTQLLGVPPTGFLWLFGPATVGLMTGAWLSGRMAGRYSAMKTISIGYCVMGAAASLNIGLNLSTMTNLALSVLPVFVYTLGMAMALPCLTLIALDPFKDQRGLASSCQGFLQSSANAVAAGIIVPMLWGSTMTLALGMSSMFILGLMATWFLKSQLQSAKTVA